MKKNIGQQVVYNPDSTCFVKSVYSADEQTGYTVVKDKRIQVVRQGWVDERKLKQTWRIR